MKISLDALNVLDAIDRRGSFAAAAEELFRVPSAISYTMQKLEQDLDTPLFDRAGHRAVLTPAGRTLLQEGRQILIAAHELEGQVKRIATGWETELRIAIDTIFPTDAMLPMVQKFFDQQSPPSKDDNTDNHHISTHKGTQIQLQQEVLGGSWDALISNRSDLVIGASGDGPAGSGYSTLLLGEFDMLFAVATDHPLAPLDEPISSSDILKYRAVAVADSSRDLPPRSMGLLTGQQVLTVPNMESKLEAQIQGLGVGYLPQHWLSEAIERQQLITKTVEGMANKPRLYAAWRSDNHGKALQWFVAQLRKPEIQEQLFQGR